VRSATTSLRGHPHSVPEARRWTVATLTSWGLDATAWNAAQVVSELATNATLHARSDFELRLVLDGGCVRVEASDRVPGGLQARTYSSTATTGRGLRIVEGLSSSWGVDPTVDGKTVWALLPLEEPLARGATA
jgi:anti-sigma regulatory factor (Ser/Thr protein kinase)